MDKIREFIDKISDDQYTDAKDAISGVVTDKFNARIAQAREGLGLKIEEAKTCSECKLAEDKCECKTSKKEEE